jgi:cytochrome c
MKRFGFVGVLVMGVIALAGQAAAEGDAAKGEKLFKGFLGCNSCHSLEAGETKVGPTLAGLFGRKAGSVEGYKRYSKAMVNSEVVWNEETLSEFLKNPKKLIPENKMEYSPGGKVPRVSSDQYRADLIAYLKEATAQ